MSILLLPGNAVHDPQLNLLQYHCFELQYGFYHVRFYNLIACHSALKQKTVISKNLGHLLPTFERCTFITVFQ